MLASGFSKASRLLRDFQKPGEGSGIFKNKVMASGFQKSGDGSGIFKTRCRLQDFQKPGDSSRIFKNQVPGLLRGPLVYSNNCRKKLWSIISFRKSTKTVFSYQLIINVVKQTKQVLTKKLLTLLSCLVRIRIENFVNSDPLPILY